MTPKEKAKALVYCFILKTENKLTKEQIVNCLFKINLAKEHAIIAVDEILNLGLLYGDAPFGNYGKQFHSYWQEVKQEIEKL